MWLIIIITFFLRFLFALSTLCFAITIINQIDYVHTKVYGFSFFSMNNSQSEAQSSLPYLPSTYNSKQYEEVDLERQLFRSKSGNASLDYSGLDNYQQTMLTIRNFTQTELSCYVAPPPTHGINLDKVYQYYL